MGCAQKERMGQAIREMLGDHVELVKGDNSEYSRYRDLSTNINLNDLSLALPADFRYEPESYHCGYLTVDEKSISIFSSSKYIMVGLKDLDEVNKLYSKMIKILDGLDINIKNSNPPTISNIVVCDEIDHTLDLNNLAIHFGLDKVTYEPESFSGLIYRVKRTFNIYHSGKILALEMI